MGVKEAQVAFIRSLQVACEFAVQSNTAIPWILKQVLILLEGCVGAGAKSC